MGGARQLLPSESEESPAEKPAPPVPSTAFGQFVMNSPQRPRGGGLKKANNVAEVFAPMRKQWSLQEESPPEEEKVYAKEKQIEELAEEEKGEEEENLLYIEHALRTEEDEEEEIYELQEIEQQENELNNYH